MRSTAVAVAAVILLVSGMLPGLASISEASVVRNTTIASPANNTYVSGVVTIRVLVRTCNCTGVTALYVDGVFISNGTSADWKFIDGEYCEQYFHKWDTAGAKKGKHRISVTGRHAEYSDTIYVHTGKKPSLSAAPLVGMMAMVTVVIIVTSYILYRIRNIGNKIKIIPPRTKY